MFKMIESELIMALMTELLMYHTNTVYSSRERQICGSLEVIKHKHNVDFQVCKTMPLSSSLLR